MTPRATISKGNRPGPWRMVGILMACLSFAPVTAMAFQTISPGIYEVDGYKLDISAYRSDGDNLTVRGRISEGGACNSLKLQMEFTEPKSRNTVRVTTTVTDVGIPKSQTIRVEHKLKKKSVDSDAWELTDIKTKCLK